MNCCCLLSKRGAPLKTTFPAPGKRGFSNEVGRCQEDSSSFFASLNLFLFAARHTREHAQQRAFARPVFLSSSIAFVPTLLAQTRVACIISVLPTNHLFGHGGP